MRKSFLYLLMSAMVLIGMGTLNSCKDYEDDIMSQFHIEQAIQDATLRDLLQACHDSCQAKWTYLLNLQRNCSTNCAKEHARLDSLIRVKESLLNGRIDSTNNSVKDVNRRIDSLARVTKALELNDSLIRVSISELEKAYKLADSLLNNRLTDLEGQVMTNKDSIYILMGKITDLTTTVNDVVSRLKIVEANYAKLNSKVDSLYQLVDGRIDELDKKIDAVKDQLNGRIDKVYNTITEIQNTINGIQQNVLDLTKLYANLDNRLFRVELQAAEALERAKNDSAWIKALQEELKALAQKEQEDSNNTNYRIDTLSRLANDIQNLVVNAGKNYDDVIAALQDRDSILADSIVNILDQKIDTLDSLYKAGDSTLNAKIDTLEKRVKANEDSIKAINTKISELINRVEKVEQSQKALVTSIELNAAINPVFGTFNLPADIRNNALIGYYGVLELSTTANFPSKAGSGFYAATRKAAADKYALTEKDWNLLGLSDGDLFKYGGSEGNILANTSDENGDSIDLGTLYVTVNPTKADFTGTTFDLVNSLDEAAPAVLSDLQPSQHKIDFGYTRAKTTGEAKNGFYEAKVSIAKDDAEAATIHTDGIESAIKQLMKKAEGAKVTVDKDGVHYSNSYVLNVSDVAVSILDNLSGITDAYALRASWNDDLIGDTRSVYSQYGLAIVPLRSRFGYASFNDFNYQTIPGYEDAWDLINKLGKSAKNFIETWIGKVEKIIDNTKIEDVDFVAPDKSLKDYTINMTIEMPAGSLKKGDDGYLYVYDDKGNVLGMIPGNAKMKDGKLVLAFNSNDIDLYPYMKPVFDAIDDLKDDVNDTYEDLRKLFADVKGLLNDIKAYEKKVDNVTGAMQNMLDALNTRVVNFVNSANYRMQPMIIANETKGAHLLSQAQSVPSEIESSTQFIVTNLVGEIISPAVKKHVACTNVFKGGVSAQDETGNFSDIQACQAEVKAINEANDMLNVVFNGDITRINVQGFKSGFTYELAFSGLDYQGLQTTRKFYVTVK